ncbi:MAG: Rieske 2Fe-2S domain-containing protein [Hyphomonadaceae bacterium]|nr:Rieske 2Fe-2S domain-containing protein [Hyphomonadaceae bacterium]GIK48456.1 MAG: ferredoxin [Alphaproteobacteria bacterium]
MTPLARLDALPDPGAIVVEVEQDGARLSLILTRSGDRVSAFRNKCPHAGYPLQRADGRLVVQESRYLVCAAHGASFTLTDGACAGGPCNGDPLERVFVDVREGVVLLPR